MGRQIVYPFLIAAGWAATSLTTSTGSHSQWERHTLAAVLAFSVPFIVAIYFLARLPGQIPGDPRPQSERDQD